MQKVKVNKITLFDAKGVHGKERKHDFMHGYD